MVLLPEGIIHGQDYGQLPVWRVIGSGVQRRSAFPFHIRQYAGFVPELLKLGSALRPYHGCIVFGAQPYFVVMIGNGLHFLFPCRKGFKFYRKIQYKDVAGDLKIVGDISMGNKERFSAL